MATVANMLASLIEVGRAARRLAAGLDADRRASVLVEVNSCLDTCNHALASIGRVVDAAYSLQGQHASVDAHGVATVSSAGTQLTETMDQLSRILAVSVEGSPIPPPRQRVSAPTPPPRSMSSPPVAMGQQSRQSQGTLSPSDAAGSPDNGQRVKRWRAQLLDMGFDGQTVDQALAANPEDFIGALGHLLAAPPALPVPAAPAGTDRFLTATHVAAAGALSPRGSRHAIAAPPTGDDAAAAAGAPRLGRRPSLGAKRAVAMPPGSLQAEKASLLAAQSTEGPGWVAFAAKPGAITRGRSHTIGAAATTAPRGNPFSTPPQPEANTWRREPAGEPRWPADSSAESTAHRGSPPIDVASDEETPQQAEGGGGFPSMSPFASPLKDVTNPFMDNSLDGSGFVASPFTPGMEGAEGSDIACGANFRVLWPGLEPPSSTVTTGGSEKRRTTQFVDTEDVSVAIRLMAEEEEEEEEGKEVAPQDGARETAPEKPPRTHDGDGPSSVHGENHVSPPPGPVQRRTPSRRCSADEAADAPTPSPGARNGRSSFDLFYSGALGALEDRPAVETALYLEPETVLDAPTADTPVAPGAGGRVYGTLGRPRPRPTACALDGGNGTVDFAACPPDEDGCLLQWATLGQQRIKRVRAGTLSQVGVDVDCAQVSQASPPSPAPPHPHHPPHPYAYTHLHVCACLLPHPPHTSICTHFLHPAVCCLVTPLHQP